MSNLEIGFAGLVAQSDVYPPGMRTVVGPATFFHGDWSWNNFYGHSLPTADSSREEVSYLQKDVHLVLVNRLWSLPRNSVVRLTDHLNMTLISCWLGRKTTNQTYKWLARLKRKEIIFKGHKSSHHHLHNKKIN